MGQPFEEEKEKNENEAWRSFTVISIYNYIPMMRLSFRTLSYPCFNYFLSVYNWTNMLNHSFEKEENDTTNIGNILTTSVSNLPLSLQNTSPTIPVSASQVSSTSSSGHSLIINNQNHKVETINDNPEV